MPTQAAPPTKFCNCAPGAHVNLHNVNAGEELEAIILDMDRVLQYDAVLRPSVTGAPLPAQALRTYTPEDVVAVCDCAQRLLILACDQVRVPSRSAAFAADGDRTS